MTAGERQECGTPCAPTLAFTGHLRGYRDRVAGSRRRRGRARRRATASSRRASSLTLSGRHERLLRNLAAAEQRGACADAWGATLRARMRGGVG